MRIRTRSVIIMFSQGLTQAAQLLLGIILVRVITQEILGTYRQVTLVYTLIAAVFSLQVESSLYYFLPKLGLSRRRDIVFQSLLSTGVFSIVIGLVMFLTAGLFAKQFNNPQLASLIRIYALFPMLERIVHLQPAFLISLDKAVISGLYSMLNAVFLISTVVIIFVLGFGIREALLGKLAVEGIFAAIGIGLMVHFSDAGQWRFDKGLFFEQFNYCWPLMMTTMVGILNLKLDGLLISSYFSEKIYAVYSTGALELPLIALFTSSITAAIMPNMVTEADQGRTMNSLNIWHEASRKSSLLIFPTFAFFLVCGYDFIVLLYTQDYSMATWPFLIYLARLPIRVAVYGAIFRALGYTKTIAVSALLDHAVNLVVSITLLLAGRHSLLSYIGPSIGTFFGTLTSVLFLLLTLCARLEIPFREVMRWKELGRIFVIAMLGGLILWITPLPIENLLLKMVIRFCFYVVLYFAMLVITRSLKPDERELIRMPFQMLQMLKRKLFSEVKV